jgi:hypothetical protein
MLMMDISEQQLGWLTFGLLCRLAQDLCSHWRLPSSFAAITAGHRYCTWLLYFEWYNLYLETGTGSLAICWSKSEKFRGETIPLQQQKRTVMYAVADAEPNREPNALLFYQSCAQRIPPDFIACNTLVGVWCTKQLVLCRNRTFARAIIIIRS